MGGMLFNPQILADSLSETVGYKAGLALSVIELCDHLSGTQYPDVILASETRMVRLRIDEYEEVFYKLLHRIGYTKEEFNGDTTGIGLIHKYSGTPLAATLEGIVELYVQMVPGLMDETEKRGSKLIDPTPLLKACYKRYGRDGLNLIVEKLEAMDRGMKLSPHSGMRYIEWHTALELQALFSGTNSQPERGTYIDQRFIDYLATNQDKLAFMHWRKFEELTAEFFAREGYKVELGPGSNDDGVDVRVWKPGQDIADHPLCLIQCKRQKNKIERVVVKGLSADVEFEGAEFGLVVTTSELSPGARHTISARGYPIREIENKALSHWLVKLRTPGTGIVRV